MKKINTVLIAKYIIQQANKKDIDLCITKLQKLLYALEGGLLANDIDVFDTYLSAWQYGPVYPVVFRKIKKEDFNKDFKDLDISEIENNTYSKQIAEMVKLVLDTFGKYTAIQLSAWSHAKGSPWDKTPIHQIISKELIKEYFSSSMKSE